MKLCPAAGVDQGFRSFMLQALEICVHRGGDREGRPCGSGLGKCRNLASLPLGLEKVEDALTIRERMIVGGADRLYAIGFLAKITAQDPLAAVQSLAVTEMQPGIDRAPVGLAGMLELCPRGRAV